MSLFDRINNEVSLIRVGELGVKIEVDSAKSGGKSLDLGPVIRLLQSNGVIFSFRSRMFEADSMDHLTTAFKAIRDAGFTIPGADL